MKKTDQLLDALEHPECHSPNEIEELLNDPEVRAIYEMLSLSRGKSFATRLFSENDIEEEWRKVQPVKSRRRRVLEALRSRKGAAIVVGVLSFSAVAVGLTVGFRYTFSAQLETSAADAPMASESVGASSAFISADSTISALPDEILFQEESLEALLSRLAPYYHVGVDYKSDAAKSIRIYYPWSKSITLEELAEQLNTFNRIHVVIDGDKLIVD